MPFHLCGDEILAIMQLMPYGSWFIQKMRALFHPHTADCHKEHP